DNQTEKPEWDNVLVPVKPLAYVTKENQKQQADVLKPGWIYIFWRGKLWRELEVKKNQALRDVNVEYYRRNWNGDFGQEAEREAEGHWQTAAWVPYKLNGEIQSGNNAPLMMYSESQLDWPYVESLEADNAKLLEVASELDLSTYSQDKHFKNAAGDMGSIEDALLDQYFDPEEHEYQVVSEKGKDLRGYRDTLVPVVYLQPQGDFFMLEVQDEDGRAVRDKTFALVIGDKEFEGLLDTKGQLKFVVPEGIPGGSGNVKIWAEGDDAEPEIIPFKVNPGSLADVSTVEGVQARCNNLGFDAGIVDGINGKKTKNAVKGFQSTFELDVDGVAGPKTQKKMKKVYKR
ncbi:MAG: peptidoglycan-binding protein, partial [Pseudomonadales bacterium]|nr:peptidoglycan-binding protein [Pseudomonadales bacterium]